MAERRRGAEIAAAACAVALLAACAARRPLRPEPVRRLGGDPDGAYRFARPHTERVERGPAPPPDSQGLRVPVPRPFLLVGPRAPSGGPPELKIVYLPDPEEEILIEPGGRRGRGPLSVTLDEGGFLAGVSGQFRSRRTGGGDGTPDLPVLAEPGAATAGLGDGSGDLAPGLYRIVLADPAGGPVPRLERVAVYPAAAEPPPKVLAVQFRTCRDRPEVLRGVEVVVDRRDGPGAPLGALAAEVRLFRDDQPLADLPHTVEGTAIAFAVDPDCRGRFAAYRVSLPADRLAPGSPLEAAFPGEEQLARWRPSAQVHLVKDERGVPRFLVVQVDPGGGSPVRPLAALDPASALLLVDGRAVRAARVTREVSAANLYLVEIPGAEPRSVFFALTPRNAADLAGPTASLVYAAGEPARPRPEALPPLRVQETSIETTGGVRRLTLTLAPSPARPVDAGRTAAANREKGWKQVRCAPGTGDVLTCTAAVPAGPTARLDIYCEGEGQPCLSVDVAER